MARSGRRRGKLWAVEVRKEERKGVPSPNRGTATRKQPSSTPAGTGTDTTGLFECPGGSAVDVDVQAEHDESGTGLEGLPAVHAEDAEMVSTIRGGGGVGVSRTGSNSLPYGHLGILPGGDDSESVGVCGREGERQYRYFVQAGRKGKRLVKISLVYGQVPREGAG